MPKSKRETILSSVKTGFLAVALVAMTVTPAAALEGDFTNDTTGADSTNNNEVAQDTNVSISITNTGDVTNDITVDLNTGGNTITDNTEVGDVTTGDVVFDAVVETEVNEVNLDLQGALAEAELSMSSSSSITSTNSNTGSNSTNDNVFDVTTDYDLNLQNDLNVVNSFDLNIDTGNNDISNNTTVGDITTGSIDVTLALATAGNQVNLGGAGGGLGAGGGSPAVISSATPQGGGLGAGAPLAEIIGGGGGFFPAGDSDGFVNLLALLTFSIITVLVSEKLGAVMKRQVNIA